MEPSITVITITRGRPHLLKRAMASMAGQLYEGPVSHLILVDDCPATASMLTSIADSSSSLFEWIHVGRTHVSVDGPSQLAPLRNLAVRLATSTYIAFLDDDNEFEPNHLATLANCAAVSGCRAVHSWRRLFLPDGAAYLEPRMPWKRDPEEGRRLYQELCAQDVFEVGSNMVRDRVDPKGHPNPARMVDMGEWLFERTLLLEFPFCEQYTYQDWLAVIPEDNKLLSMLVESGIPIASTEQATLRYYLGGYSNSFSTEPTSSIRWANTFSTAAATPGTYYDA